jgi:hypothetical protein
MWLEMASRGQDGSQHSFEITDKTGQLLIELPFSEVFRTLSARAEPRRKARHRVSTATTAKSRSLAAEIASLVAVAQNTLVQAQLILARARVQVS